MDSLKIAGLNFDITWKDKERNFQNIEQQFRNITADVYVLPEMFSTGFYMYAAEIADRNTE